MLLECGWQNLVKSDVMMLIESVKNDKKINHFSTKANTLFDLLPSLKSAKILPLYFFTVSNWKDNHNDVLAELRKVDWFSSALVVRSSALDEDCQHASKAGQYTSIVNITGEENFIAAVEEVIASFDVSHSNNQILVQPYLCDVTISGVAFSRDPNTDSPYVLINYDDFSGDTASITSGSSNHKCYFQHYKSSNNNLLNDVIRLVYELKDKFETDCLDIEFAINSKNELCLFQVRPLIIKIKSEISDQEHYNAIERIANRIALGMKPHPYLYGKQTIYGVMPDWNPAEIIGIRPKPLALSLYRELVTDSVWAYQRDNYGYANLRSFPLLVDFEGLPYIDVRVSFNSFLPKELPSPLSEKLVNYYLDRLIDSPSLHDKVEFDIVFSCYTLDLQDRLIILEKYNFDESDCATIFSALVTLTNQIIHNQQGLWRKDLEKIEELRSRQQILFQSDLDSVSKMYWILEDCKRYGTLPFAGLARAGFIAIQILKSFISVGIINEEEYACFLSSVNSVSSTMNIDFQKMSRIDFLEKYGHLRPGTYDVLSPRYDEEPNIYFDWKSKEVQSESKKTTPFSLSIAQLRKIQEKIDKDGLKINVLELLEFIQFAIESREYAKFIFSKNVSEFLKIATEFSAKFNITREDCAYIDLSDIIKLYTSSIDPSEVLRCSVSAGKKRHQLTSTINLPPVIIHPEQGWSFELPDTTPNFITQKKATGKLAFPDTQKGNIENTILMIPSADPGYDWIFSHKIAGFITQYGGVNSHMAIRAGELGIPAVIGAGEIKFNDWKKAKKLHIDCANKQVQIL
ncbi:MAG: PEP/pyruvate-binding domain-containing protein [Coxiellaceae bacterium]|nr:PEP/pyruvate-binding domain-containing protein [Coxiellaceae bacterium]